MGEVTDTVRTAETRSQLIVGGAVLMAVGFLGIVMNDVRNGTLRELVVEHTIGWFLVAAVGYLVVIVAGERRTPPLRWLLVFGLVLRLALLSTEPTLSDDVYRYLWEGHLVTEGVSPYSFTIDDPAGIEWDIPARTLANNRTLASPYLPVAHGVFGLAALVLPSSPWVMQVVMLGFEALGLACMIRILRYLRLPDRRVLLWWLNPLVIIEIAHGAHLDAAIVGLGLLGIWWTLHTTSGSRLALWGAPIAIAAATLTRPLALLFIPVLIWMWTWRQRVTWAVTLTVPVLLAGAATSFGLDDSGTGVFGSARAYTETFRFNSAIYQRFEMWVSSQGLDDRGWNEPVALTRLVVFAAVAVALITMLVRARTLSSDRQRIRWLVAPLALYVLATPVMHPWYVLTLLALVPMLAPGDNESTRRWLDVAPWIALSVLLVFSYLTYLDPSAFAERAWVRRLEWWPTFTLLALAVVSRVAGSRFELIGRGSSR